MSLLALAAVLATAGVMLAPTAAGMLGLSFYIVRGQSMTPTIKPGSLAVTRETPVQRAAIGDVIVFQAPWLVDEGDPVTVIHRITWAVPSSSGTIVYTKGDGTPLPDPSPTHLRGTSRRVTATIPYIGYLYAILPFVGGLSALLGSALMADWAFRRKPHDAWVAQHAPQPYVTNRTL
jgi:signal peptidase